MRKNIIFITTFFLFISVNVFAQNAVLVTFLSNLSQGDSNSAVLSLQKLLNNDPDTKVATSGVGSPGEESSYFGALTRAAVIRFQEKYKNEVLTPAGLSYGTGYVGAMTIKKLNQLASMNVAPAANQVRNQTPVAPVSGSTYNPSQAANSSAPVVLSVYPEKVRRGDVVTIKGKNFTPVDNIVILGDGPVKERFDGLASMDGETLSFVYEPPSIKTMTKDQILALPPAYLKQIEEPLQKIGATVDDIVTPFKGINNETELREMLAQNGHSFDEMYHYFYILVFNSKGNTMSQTALLHGLREFPFDNVAQKNTGMSSLDINKLVANVLSFLFPTAYAQASQSGGGFTTGIVMVCTCNGNLMTVQMDYSGGGSGLYVFSPGFRPNAGSGLVAGPWLGGYQQSGGTCEVGVRPYCATITGNTPQKPVGYAF